jgi:hypothetical protein
MACPLFTKQGRFVGLQIHFFLKIYMKLAQNKYAFQHLTDIIMAQLVPGVCDNFVGE